MSSDEHQVTRTLLEESDWLHRLAARLVRDPAAAADAAQETLVVLSGQPAGVPRTRKWLGSVLRNFLRQGQRSGAIRSRREQGGACAEAERSSAETAVHLETQRRILDAVQALEEPYRSTISMRFLEGNAPREVARRMGVPVKTVHTRVERGLARLRRMFDAGYGGRSAWLAVLVPFARSGILFGGSSLGVVLMSSTLKWAGSVAAVCVIAWCVQSFVGGDAVIEVSEAGSRGAIASMVGDEKTVEGDMGLNADGARRVAVESPRVETEITALPPRVIGRVVDVQNRSVSGIEVRFELTSGQSASVPLDQQSAVSRSDGQFEIGLSAKRGRLIGRGRGYAPVISPGIAGVMPAEPPLVVVGPERSYAGFVRDQEGQGLVGVNLAVFLDEAHADRLRPDGWSRIVPLSRASTGSEGEFAITSLGYVEGSRLEAKLDGFDPLVTELPAISSNELVLTLVKSRVDDTGIAGVVLDQRGESVEGARVSAGESTTRSAADGSFVLDSAVEDGLVLRAIATGWLPASRSIADIGSESRDQVVLTLGEEARRITGRVVDSTGVPIEGAQVWTFEGEHFGYVLHEMSGTRFYINRDVEEIIAGSGNDGREARSDVAGEFELSSLTDRRYTVLAMHPRTLVVARAEAVMAGTGGVVIVLGPGERAGRVAGTVMSYGGEPIVGAVINVLRRISKSGGGAEIKQADLEFNAVVDDDGHFAFAEIGLAGTTLILSGEMIPSPQTIRLADIRNIEQVKILVPARCHLRVYLQTDTDFADSLELLDAEGKKLNLSFMIGGVSIGANSVDIGTGQSPLIQTDESATMIVLLGKDGMEVHRESITLRAGEVNEIRF